MIEWWISYEQCCMELSSWDNKIWILFQKTVIDIHFLKRQTNSATTQIMSLHIRMHSMHVHFSLGLPCSYTNTHKYTVGCFDNTGHVWGWCACYVWRVIIVCLRVEVCVNGNLVGLVCHGSSYNRSSLIGWLKRWGRCLAKLPWRWYHWLISSIFIAPTPPTSTGPSAFSPFPQPLQLLLKIKSVPFF